MTVDVSRLNAFVGTWSMHPTFANFETPDDVVGRVTFEWLPGETFLTQRWDVSIPEAPDGLCVIGWDVERASLMQYYFDSRGVARMYVMTLEDSRWTLERHAPDFSPLGFHQRWTSEFAPDGNSITGRWEASDDGAQWTHDFDLTYTRAS